MQSSCSQLIYGECANICNVNDDDMLTNTVSLTDDKTVNLKSASEQTIEFDFASCVEFSGQSQPLITCERPDKLMMATCSKVKLYDQLCKPYSQTRVVSKIVRRSIHNERHNRWRSLPQANNWSLFIFFLIDFKFILQCYIKLLIQKSYH